MKGGGVGVEANNAVFAASIETKASIEAIEGQLAQLQAQNAALSEIDRSSQHSSKISMALTGSVITGQLLLATPRSLGRCCASGCL